jgi:branched-chain amino acid transport system substrate-binding protein
MLGPLHGGISMAVEPYLSQVPVPSLSIEPQIAPITKFGWFFLTSGTVDGVTRPVGWYAAEELGAKTAIIISRDDIPGRLFMAGWRRGFEEKGGKVVQEFWTPLLVADFSSYLLAMKEADIVAVWAGTACETLLKQADEFGKLDKMPWMLAHQGSLTEVTMQDVGKQLLKIKACGVVYSKLVDTPANKKYLAAARESGTKTPSVYHEEGYEAATIAVAALEATGGDTDPHKLKKAILGLKLETPTGTVSYTPQGVAVRDLFIFNVKNVEGEYLWSPIKTYPQYTPEIILE